jgi:mercuric ion binding protein
MIKMKKLIMFISLFVIVSLGLQAQDQPSKAKTACFKSSMDCAGCENTIFETLRFEKGVKDIKADYLSNTIKVVFDERKNSSEALAKVVQEKGYKAEVISEEEYKKLTTPVKQEAPSK